MRLSNTEYTRQQRVHELAREMPALDASATARALAVVLAAGTVGALGALVIGLSLPDRGTTPVHIAGMVFGGTCMIAWLFVLSFVWHHVQMWRADLRYERERREAVLESHWNAQGVTTTESISETTITSDNTAMVILTALALHQQRNSTKRPYSIRALQQPLFLAVNARAFGTSMIRLGQVASEGEAAKLADLFVRSGLITNRREKTAGDWQATSMEDVLARLLPA